MARRGFGHPCGKLVDDAIVLLGDRHKAIRRHAGREPDDASGPMPRRCITACPCAADDRLQIQHHLIGVDRVGNVRWRKSSRASGGDKAPVASALDGGHAATVGFRSIVASTSRTRAARAGFSITAAIMSPSESPICCAEASTRASNPLISTMAPVAVAMQETQLLDPVAGAKLQVEHDRIRRRCVESAPGTPLRASRVCTAQPRSRATAATNCRSPRHRPAR